MSTRRRVVFSYLPLGQSFETEDGETLIKRRENRRADLVRFCFDCGEQVGGNAIKAGIKIDDAGWHEFVHFCPMAYVWI